MTLTDEFVRSKNNFERLKIYTSPPMKTFGTLLVFVAFYYNNKQMQKLSFIKKECLEKYILYERKLTKT